MRVVVALACCLGLLAAVQVGVTRRARSNASADTCGLVGIVLLGQPHAVKATAIWCVSSGLLQALPPKPSPYGLLQLEGPVSTASLASPQGKRHHHSQNHKKSHYKDSHYGDSPSYAPYDSQYPSYESQYPPHDSYYMQGPHDSYWDPRYQAKAELIACVKAATAIFDKDDTSTWEAAGEFLAHCLEQHLGGCHDV